MAYQTLPCHSYRVIYKTEIGGHPEGHSPGIHPRTGLD